MITESKYCPDMIKKHFIKKLVMIKEDNEDFESSTKCWICDHVYDDDIDDGDDDVKVRNRCHITGKYRSSIVFQDSYRIP